MLKRIKVNLGRRSYEILIGKKILTRLGPELRKLNLGTDVYIITNSWLKQKYGRRLGTVLSENGFNFCFKIIPEGEKSKSLELATRILQDLAQFEQQKKVFILAFGGGVIGDLAGFVASIYKRGINYLQVPTTLLAQVDSAIGGKTAVDLNFGKNLVGAIYQPRLVFSDIDFLQSLTQEQLIAGMAEVIKYAVIRDKKFFKFLEDNRAQILKKSSLALLKCVSICSEIKAQIVSRDEYEKKGLRTILNFGHTFGHAIETAGKYRGYNHGQAVALGMLAALDLSFRLKLLKPENLFRVKELIKNYGLPTKVKGINLKKIIQAHYYDKKFFGKVNRLVLVPEIGRFKIVRNINLDLIRSAAAQLI